MEMCLASIMSQPEIFRSTRHLRELALMSHPELFLGMKYPFYLFGSGGAEGGSLLHPRFWELFQKFGIDSLLTNCLWH